MLSKYTFDMDKWKSELSRFIDYAEERPTKMIQYMQDSSKDYSMAVTKEELNLYFADAIQAIYDYKEAKK